MLAGSRQTSSDRGVEHDGLCVQVADAHLGCQQLQQDTSRDQCSPEALGCADRAVSPGLRRDYLGAMPCAMLQAQ